MRGQRAALRAQLSGSKEELQLAILDEGKAASQQDEV